MKKLKLQRSGLFLAAMLLSGLCGCRQESAPELPRARSAMIIRLFENLQQKRYVEAQEQINKLQLEDPDKAFLAEMDWQTYANSQMIQAQQALDQGKIAESLAVIERALRKQPFNPQLLTAMEELRRLQRLQNNVLELERARSSRELGNAIAVLDELRAGYPPAKPLEAILKKSAARQVRMNRQERREALFSLGADLADCRRAGDTLADTLEALYRYSETLPENRASQLAPAERKQLLSR